MDEQHSEKLWLYSSRSLPLSAPSSVSKAQLLDGHIEFRTRGFKTDNSKIHDCTLHYRPVYWTVCALFTQTVCRLWQTVNCAESIFSLCGVWMVILKCTSLALPNCFVCFRWWTAPWMWSRVLTVCWPAWALAWWLRLITWPFTAQTSVSHTHTHWHNRMHEKKTEQRSVIQRDDTFELGVGPSCRSFRKLSAQQKNVKWCNSWPLRS